MTTSPFFAASRARIVAATLLAATALAHSTPVSMPTPQGSSTFDSGAFAFATLAGPSGEFACFTHGSLLACSPALMDVAALGPDLTVGLALGMDGEISLALPGIGSAIAIWEGGELSTRDDVSATLVSVHTAAGWTPFRSLGAATMAPVLNDIRPSGYETNFAMLSAADFGLPAGTLLDGVRIDACCGGHSDFDLLAVAAVTNVVAVPEPSTFALLGSGLLALGFLSRRRAVAVARAQG